jgi:DNA-binding XRE family transcriptional regulator
LPKKPPIGPSAPIACFQQRQEGVRDPYDAEDVRVVRGQHVGPGDLADRLARAHDPGIVDQDVETARVRAEEFGCRLHGILVGDVELNEAGAEHLGRRSIAVGIACPNMDGVPGLDQTTSRLETEALVRSSDGWSCAHSGHRWIGDVSPIGAPQTNRQCPPQPVDQQYQGVHARQRDTGAMSKSRELGRALHGWRDRIAPATVGLPARGIRRAAGLRRAELAQLAGLSVDYITRLEQGRATSPSAQVLSVLARALRLSAAEREYLYLLAGPAGPGPRATVGPRSTGGPKADRPAGRLPAERA